MIYVITVIERNECERRTIKNAKAENSEEMCEIRLGLTETERYEAVRFIIVAINDKVCHETDSIEWIVCFCLFAVASS